MSKPLCRLCPYRKEGWPECHRVPCSLLMQKERTSEPQIYQKDVANTIDEELLRLDGEPSCTECSHVIDKSVEAAESGLMYLLEQEIAGTANTPDWLPPSQQYEKLVTEVRSEWAADKEEEYEAGLPDWMCDSSSSLGSLQLASGRRLGNSLLSSKGSSPQKLTQSSANQSPPASPIKRRSTPYPDELMIPTSQRKQMPLHVSGHQPHDKSSPYILHAERVPVNHHPQRTKPLGEPGRVLSRSPSPLVGPHTKYEGPKRDGAHGREVNELYAQLKKGIRTKSSYKSKPLTTGGDYPSLMIPRRLSNYDLYKADIEYARAHPTALAITPHSEAAEAHIVKEAVKRQTARVCQEIIERKHSLDRFLDLSPRDTAVTQETRLKIMKAKNDVLDKLKKKKDRMVEQLADFSHSNIGTSVGEASTQHSKQQQGCESKAEKSLVKEARQLLHDLVPGQREEILHPSVAELTLSSATSTEAIEKILLGNNTDSSMQEEFVEEKRDIIRRNSLVLEQLLNRVDGLAHHKDQSSHDHSSSPPYSTPPGPASLHTSRHTSTQVASVPNNSAAKTDPRFNNSRILKPIAESTAIEGEGCKPHRFAYRTLQHEPRTPDRVQHNMSGPQSPIVIEITTNPTIINATDPSIVELNQSLEELLRVGKANQDKCEELADRAFEMERVIREVHRMNDTSYSSQANDETNESNEADEGIMKRLAEI